MRSPAVVLRALACAFVLACAGCGDTNGEAETTGPDGAAAAEADAAAGQAAQGTEATGQDSGAQGSAASPEADEPLPPAVVADLDIVFASLAAGVTDTEPLERLAEAGDPRLGWLFSDILRFVSSGTDYGAAALEAFSANTGFEPEGGVSAWGQVTDHMIAADHPAPPGYASWKGLLFRAVEPGWTPFFEDDESLIDWRWVSWGGVLIDDRPVHEADRPCPRGCIPALNDPPTVAAGSDEDWLDDDRVVFGVVVDGDAVALPKNMMEVHEMVNMTIGGRRVGIPYCTLCGSAQAYLTDDLAGGVDLGGAEAYELRTSGLLSRSNKVMYELHTFSVIDTFTGRAVSGPLREAGVTLEQISVVTSRWGAFKQAHPGARLLAEDGGIGRSYPDDPLGGRDDDGPIFPIGDVDPRLGVQEPVVGVIAADGTPLAFPAAPARAALLRGETVEVGGVELQASGDGFTAAGSDGAELTAHEAFWFAWSQFHPDTELWDG